MTIRVHVSFRTLGQGLMFLNFEEFEEALEEMVAFSHWPKTLDEIDEYLSSTIQEGLI